MVRCAPIVAAALGACAVSADAAVFFTFDDPGPTREVQYSADTNTLTYAGAPTFVDLVVDATDEGAASAVTYEAVLEMQITVGNATPVMDIDGGFTAPVSGFFQFSMPGSPDFLLRGDFSGGGLVTLGGAGAVITTSNTGLTYTADGDLLTFLSDAGIPDLIAPFDASFTLTDVSPSINVDDGEFEDFTANAAFTGTANIPAPTTLLCAVAGAAALGTRRRRN